MDDGTLYLFYRLTVVILKTMKRLLTICLVVMGFFASAQEPVTLKFTIEPVSGHYLLKCNAHLSPG